ncbi:11243_t:CDS:2, partial [Funneliformis geosporum]
MIEMKLTRTKFPEIEPECLLKYGEIEAEQADYEIYDLNITDNNVEEKIIKVKDLTDFVNNWLKRLFDNDFISQFANQEGEARTFANNPDNRAGVLAYQKTGTGLGGEIEISGTQAERDFYPLTTSFAQAQKEIWIDAFHG